MYDKKFKNSDSWTTSCQDKSLIKDNFEILIIILDDYGLKVCGEYMEFIKKCNTRNTKEE